VKWENRYIFRLTLYKSIPAEYDFSRGIGLRICTNFNGAALKRKRSWVFFPVSRLTATENGRVMNQTEAADIIKGVSDAGFNSAGRF